MSSKVILLLTLHCGRQLYSRCCMWQNVGLRSWKSFRVKKWGLEPSSLTEVYTYAIFYIGVPWKFYPTCALVRDATSWTSHRHAKSSTHQLASTKSQCTKESTCQLGSEVYMSTMMTCRINTQTSTVTTLGIWLSLSATWLDCWWLDHLPWFIFSFVSIEE